MSNRPLLIDADILVFRAAAACERDVRWDDENHVLTSNSKEVWDCMHATIDTFRKDLGNGPAYFAFTGVENFRRTLWPDYKGGRSRKPLCFAATRDRMIKEYDARIVEGIEADDLLGIWATSGKIKNPIIVSLDKDLKTIPTTIYRPPANSKQSATLVDYLPHQSDYWWMMQTLTGDPTDGYKGLPGVGEKGAAKIIECGMPLETLWEQVRQAFIARGLDEDDALLQARLARILRAEDWDSKKKEVKLWTPN